MVEKQSKTIKNNKKTKVKSKEIDKKVDLQESQENINGSKKDDKEKPEEIKTEEPDLTEGMVYCKNCKEEVEPYPVEHNRWRCPNCQKYTQSPVMEDSDKENVKEVKSSKDRPYQILSSRNTKFSGSELAQAEMLIQSGVAKDFNDLARKAFNLLFLKEKLNKAFSGGINAMENQENKEPNPERTMKEIQQQEMMKAYIEGMRKGNQPNPMEMMMMQRQMENMDKGKSSGDNNFMDKMMQLQMMKMMSGGENQQVLALQREIADLKQQMQMQQMMNQQQQMQQGNQSSQQFMQQMEAIRAERDKSIKQAEIMAQQERDKNLQLAFDNRRIELESRLQAMEKEMKEKGNGQVTTQRIKQMKEEISAIKEMSRELGEREKGAGEYISETVGNLATTLQPALTRFIEQRERQREMQMIPMPQMPQNPGLEFAEPEIEPQFIPSDMTESEKQMSDTMEDMYIKKRKRE